MESNVEMDEERDLDKGRVRQNIFFNRQQDPSLSFRLGHDASICVIDWDRVFPGVDESRCRGTVGVRAVEIPTTKRQGDAEVVRAVRSI